MFLVSKCQVASAASYDPVKTAEGLEAAIQKLSEAKNYFAQVDCRDHQGCCLIPGQAVPRSWQDPGEEPLCHDLPAAAPGVARPWGALD